MPEQRKNKILKKWIIVACVLTFLFCFAWYENHHLVVTYYDYSSEKVADEMDGYHIVQISDLHNAAFGRDNKKLISKIINLSPDIVVITGDIVDSNHTDLDAATRFVQDISKVCPVYYVTGNHEYWLNEADRQTLMYDLENAGVYKRNDMTMLVSRGFGNSVIPIRLFNYPEIVCIELSGA